VVYDDRKESRHYVMMKVVFTVKITESYPVTDPWSLQALYQDGKYYSQGGLLFQYVRHLFSLLSFLNFIHS
jgi:hypothetical protein